ncbi:DUF6229 family protein [Luteibacter sp. PPL201]|jgi:hypothetical protein|uniref:DUF6229 family protein n=1 Tax=Luteibacter sahnii TaxID=3021977 RepID=A0ABT6BBN7_9GAMM|nr:DUF6229 family protein [Luteibacter sp. PPL193]MDY1547432.1 DUF6229 family protein [Luteibacter sp. PPL193]
MSNDMVYASRSTSRAAEWRHQAGRDNPAGELFANGFAEADIVGGTEIVVTNCAMCTGSIERTIRIQCA